MNQKIYFDFGNAILKWIMPSTKTEASVLHAIHRLTDTQWNQAVNRTGKPPEGYIRVNGVPYVVGEPALRKGIPVKPLGSARYTPEYYGIGMCYAIASSIDSTVKNITLYGSHAPGDIDYANDLKSAALGRWRVEYMGKQFSFSVTSAYVFDEPMGGFCHFVLTKDGDPRKNNPIEKSTTLVMDIGGKTTDIVAVDSGGRIDISSLYSESTGIIKVLENFENALRANNTAFFKQTDNIDQRRLNKAFVEGSYRGGGQVIPCDQEAEESANLLMYDIDNILSRAGGLANYDDVLLTGGGAGLMSARLQATYPRIPFHLAEPDMDMAHFANVRGGRKLFVMLERLGVL